MITDRVNHSLNAILQVSQDSWMTSANFDARHANFVDASIAAYIQDHEVPQPNGDQGRADDLFLKRKTISLKMTKTFLPSMNPKNLRGLLRLQTVVNRRVLQQRHRIKK